MNFIEELRAVKENGLKKVGTTLHSCDGKIFSEEFNRDTGNYQRKLVGKQLFGWIRDDRLDLQVAKAAGGLYVGSQDAASSREILKENKITHILNLAPDVVNFFPTDFVYLKIPVLDTPETRISKYFAQTNKFLTQSISDGGRTFVHCNAGVSRSVTIAIAYMVTSLGLSVDTALERLKVVRPCICPNRGFLEQLKEYEMVVREH